MDFSSMICDFLKESDTSFIFCYLKSSILNINLKIEVKFSIFHNNFNFNGTFYKL